MPRMASSMEHAWVAGCLHRRIQASSKEDTASPTGHAASYWTLASPHSASTEVKRSRFDAHAWPCTSADEACSLIAAHSDASASHNCWAYRLDQHAYRSSDDGEPSGTAGRPILAAIDGEGLQGVAVLVVRYFGGTKLGAGGLVRAYGGAARDCLRGAPRRQVTPTLSLRLLVPYELLGTVYGLLEQHGAVKQQESYDAVEGASGAAPAACLVVGLEAERAPALEAALADATSGRVRAETPPPPPGNDGGG